MSEELNKKGWVITSRSWSTVPRVQGGNVAQKMDSEAALYIVQESDDFMIELHMDRFSDCESMRDYHRACLHIDMAIQYMKIRIKKKHCE